MNDVEWKKVPHEEYNEEQCTYKNVRLRIYSDRDGECWHVLDVDDDELVEVNLSSRESAKRAAIKYVNDNEGAI
jgi:hypothetical protein